MGCYLIIYKDRNCLYEFLSVNQYHIFKFGEVSLTAHLTILGDWMDEDLVKIHKFLSNFELRESQFVNNQIGEILEHEDFSEYIGYKVGLRSYLGSHMAVIESPWKSLFTQLLWMKRGM